MGRRRLGILGLAGFLIVGCATTDSVGFRDEARREQKARPPAPASTTTNPIPSSTLGADTNLPPPPPPVRPTLELRTDPSEARIEVNGQFAGSGTCVLDTGYPGTTYRVTVKAEGYRSRTLQITAGGQTGTEFIALDPILGTLRLGEVPPGAEVRLDGVLIRPGALPARIGRRVLEWKRFGFESGQTTVAIREAESTEFRPTWTPVGFSLSRQVASRLSFNPRSPGLEGSVRFRFAASAPGRARLAVTSRDGTEVASWDFPELTWSQSWVWSGVDAAGQPLADGPYTVTLVGSDTEDPGVSTQITVVVDHTLTLTFRGNTLAPGAGLLWAASAETLPSGVTQLSAIVLGHAGVVDQEAVVQAPVAGSFRVGLAPDWELDGHAVARLWSDSWLNAVYGGLQVKHRFVAPVPDFHWAIQAGVTLGTWMQGGLGVPPTDFLTDYPGGKIGVPITWTFGAMTVVASPEVAFGPWAPDYRGDDPRSNPFRIWTYGRTGVVWDLGDGSIGFSAALRSRPVDRGLGIEGPGQLGFEAGLRPHPQFPLTVSVLAAAEVFGPTDFAIYGGLGIGLLFEGFIPPDLASH